MRSVATHHVLTERGNLPVVSTDAPQRGADARSGLPWVVFVPSIFGVAPDLRVQMAELGDHAQVLAVDPFHHAGGGPLPYTDFAQAVVRLQQTDLPGFHAELVALLSVLTPQAPVIGVGICFGGPFVVRAAGAGLLAGVVTWHGSRLETQLDALRSLAERGVPARLHFGDTDAFVPMSTVDTVRAALGDRASESVVVHPGADHGFSHRSGPKYQAVAERAGLNAVLDLVRSCTPR
ncbi:MAG: dienelactone hydrolase family protein [Sandaracinaceae bacterium]|jgi:dienelactone hydrolase|nr:dienelactone hydrolase family protein [Sandaracinaceae bacterium]MBK7777464.1 dienelactone hydrolase family protein [Sandaracinaceae bacterium]MBK8409681.1 dienelactone hydrolase family protein [Sandaracinaceae bacterium]